MRSILGLKFLILILTACSNVPEMETAEIRAFYAIREALINYDASKTFIDVYPFLTFEFTAANSDLKRLPLSKDSLSLIGFFNSAAVHPLEFSCWKDSIETNGMCMSSL